MAAGDLFKVVAGLTQFMSKAGRRVVAAIPAAFLHRDMGKALTVAHCRQSLTHAWRSDQKVPQVGSILQVLGYQTVV